MSGKLMGSLKSTRTAYVVAAGLQALARGLTGLLAGRRGSADHLRSTGSLLTLAPSIAGRPMNVTIEPTNLCNLECPVCETGAGMLGRKQNHMAIDDFRAIIDRVGLHTNTLMFYFMGEPFLNRYAYDMIRYAKDAGIPFVTTCTNGDAVIPGKLVASGLDEVNFQIGGLHQATHEVYRVNSRLDRVIDNLRETVRIKRESGSSLQVRCGFILMKHNEHEVGEFRKRAEEWGVDAATIVDPVVRTMDQAHDLLPTDRRHWVYEPEAFERGELRPRTTLPNICPWIYYSVAILVNGDVVPCCRDPKGSQVMGNVLQEDFISLWNGPRFREFRARLLRDQASIPICRLCSGYGVSTIR